jgi:NAD(P)H-dependent FMN reductase
METKLKILGFAGSLRVGSYNKALLRAAIDLLPDDTTLETFDLNGIRPFNPFGGNVLNQILSTNKSIQYVIQLVLNINKLI